MKKLLLFFTKPLVSGILALFGTLELLWSIPSRYLTSQIPVWMFYAYVSLSSPYIHRNVLKHKNEQL